MDPSFGPVSLDEIWTLTEVVFINLILSGDNAIAMGMVAVGLPPAQRQRALWIGIALATALLAFFSLLATELLQVLGLVLAGGILLLWVSWRLWSELRHSDTREEKETEALLEGRPFRHHGERKSFPQALWQIIVANLSMSLDNVLAVAGAARKYPTILVIGLALSVLFMGLAATLVARLLERHRWLAYVGLGLIIYVSLQMIWNGGSEVLESMGWR